jgi:hypothetical protein
MSELNEISKKLRFIEKAICCVSTSTLTISENVPTTSVTRTATLTGSLVALPNEACIMVEIFNSDTTAITVQANGGSSNLLLPSSVNVFYTTNTNTISVRGTGTLIYTVVK